MERLAVGTRQNGIVTDPHPSALPTSRETTWQTLRFSLFLQSVALLVLSAALIVRVSVLGWDLVAFFFVIGVLLVGGAVAFTLARLNSGQ